MFPARRSVLLPLVVVKQRREARHENCFGQHLASIPESGVRGRQGGVDGGAGLVPCVRPGTKTEPRLDCFGGGTGALVRYYESCGYQRAGSFDDGGWPGQILTRSLAH